MPSSIKRFALVLGLGLLVPLVAGDSPAYAAPPTGSSEDWPRTAAEDEVWKLYMDGRLLTARRKVEELLAEDEDSIVGHFVLGSVLREAEGSLPQAMHHVGRARELYENKYIPGRTPGAPWPLHREILYAAQRTAGELERNEYRLQLIDFHDSLYSPRLTAEHAWPLMRLGRYDEAREYAKKAADAVDPFQRSLGLNALCAIEGEAGTRARRLEACARAFEDAQLRAANDDPFGDPETLTSLTVHAYNAALAAEAAFDSEEVERYAVGGTSRLEFTPANPWRLLVRHYTAQGRMSDAVDALREMQRWRRRQPPNLRNQSRADTDAAFAEVLLVAGETDDGMRVMNRALERPDRRGLTTTSAEQTRGAHALLRRAMSRSHAERHREWAIWEGTEARVKAWKETPERVTTEWGDAERIVAVLAEDEPLIETFRTHAHRGLDPLPTWLVGDLVEILGPGIVEVALEEAMLLEREEPEMAERLEPFHDATRAEIHLARGDYEEAIASAEKALARLPDAEALLRARVAAVAGEAAWEGGDEERAARFWAEAMGRDAGIIRRRGLSLPARVVAEGRGAAADKVVELLERSPRVRIEGTGFVIQVSGEGQALRLCMFSPDGAELGCVDPEWPTALSEGEEGEEAEPPSDEVFAGFAVGAFHERVFAMPVGLSNVDLASLDGTATLSSEAARERMEGLLEQLAEGEGVPD